MRAYRCRFTPELFVLLLIACACIGGVLLPLHNTVAGQQKDDPAPPSLAPVRPGIDNYFGTKVVDPYRYMENLKDPEVQAWMKAQNDYTRAALASIPGRERLLARIRQLDQSVPQVFARQLPGNLYVIWKQVPGDQVMKIYLRRGLHGSDRLVVDPEKVTLAATDRGKGRGVVKAVGASNDGKYLAALIVPGGDELHGELHVFNTVAGKETGDVITGAGVEVFRVCWLPDNRSFVYGRPRHLPPGAPASETRQKFRSYLHVLGTDPAKDRPVFGYGVVPSIKVDPSLIASVQTQPASRYTLGVLNGSVTPNSAYYIEPIADLGKTNTAWRRVANLGDGVTSIVMHGDDLYVLTYKNAPRYKVIRMDARNPELTAAEMVVAPSRAVVTQIDPAQDALYVELLDGGINRVLRVRYGPHPQVEEVGLPVKGSAFIETDPRLPGAQITMTSWTKPFTIYAYDPATKQMTDTGLQPAGPYDKPGNIESVEVKVRSYDQTLVPLSIVYRKNLKLDGSNPALLEGYGAYGFSYPSYFDPMLLAWYGKGGIHAVCHVRGGGEYGEEWHLAGKGPTKPNTWRDFIACAQYLIRNKYTSPAHLAGKGVSAGGILVGRAITSRPDLFGGAIDQVGLSDALRFETTQNGETNIPEFGSVTTKAGFNALYAMSAYHHITTRTAYPAVLLETGMNDPLVDPWQMAKMTARLQSASSSGKPVLLRIDYAGGHGSLDASRSQTEGELADEWSFLLWQFGVPGFQPEKQ